MQIEDFVIGNYYRIIDKNDKNDTWYFKIYDIIDNDIYAEDWAINGEIEYSRDKSMLFIDKGMLNCFNVKLVEFSDFSKFLSKNNPEIILHRKERINKLLYER